MASTTQDTQAKTAKIAPNKSAIYVIRSAKYSGELHFVAIDKGERVALAAMTYTKFTVDPGDHTLVFDSAVNREKLKVSTVPGRGYFIDMGRAWAGGMGHVKVAPRIVDESEGRTLLSRAKLAAPED
jgi:hypothetical protein